jgi:hypothetical protein
MNGVQFCKYVGINCPYTGKQAVMSMKVGRVEEKGKVTLCNLNGYESKELKFDESELEQMLTELENES